MAEAVDTNLQDAGQFATCERCGRKSGLNWSFAFGKPIRAEEPAGGAVIKCVRCAIRHASSARSLSLNFWTLPVEVLAMGPNTTLVGTLKWASSSRQ